jgi:hypothetical protein
MKKESWIIPALLILSAFVATAHGQANAENQKLLAELLELSRKIYEAGYARNQEFLDKHIAPDFMLNDDWGDFLNTYQSVYMAQARSENEARDHRSTRPAARGRRRSEL